MVKYVDKNVWVEQVLMPDESTPILGGTPDWDDNNMLAGWSNVPAGQLADRTRFLKEKVEELEQEIETGGSSALQKDNNLSDLQDVGQAKFNLGLNLVDNTRDLNKPVSNLTQDALDEKVDKEAGKGLSSNDFTTAEKNKLSGIQAGAQVNVATDLGVGTRTTTSVPVTSSTGTAATLPAATTSLAGVMTSADKTKLDGIATGATANATNAQLRDRSTHTGEQAISTITGLQTALNSKVDKVTGMGLSQESFTTSEKNKLAGLESSKFKGEFISLAALQSALPTTEVGSYAYVDQGVGQEVVKYIWDSTDTRWVLQQGESAVLTPADVKSLYEANANTNAFTDAEKTKLSGIQTGAQVNTVTSVAGKTGAVTLVKGDVGLGNVDNTSDASKPISTATQTALNTKAAVSHTHDASAIVSGTISDARLPALNATKANVLDGTNNLYVSGGTYLNVISWNNMGSLSANTSINLDTSLNHRLTAAASLTLDATNVDPGKTGDIVINTPTAVTVSWTAKWNFLGSVPNIGGAGETWVVSYKVFDANTIYAAAVKVA